MAFPGQGIGINMAGGSPTTLYADLIVQDVSLRLVFNGPYSGFGQLAAAIWIWMDFRRI